MLVEAGGYGAVMLDLVEEALDEVAAFVELRTEGGRINALVERSDVGPCTLTDNHGAQRVAVVAAVSQQNAFARQCAKHVDGALAIMRLAFSQLERDREAARIDERVDLGRKPAAGTAHATTSAAFFSPLAAC